MTRSSALQAFLDQSGAALRSSTTGEGARAAERARALWQVPGAAGNRAPVLLPVCGHLAPALAAAAQGPRAPLAAAFAALAPGLAWHRKASADPGDAGFWAGHANAMILGPGGLEERADLWIGATLMAPGTTYPDHTHPPEEVYLSLAPGEWGNAAMDWADPGPLGHVYNPPGILHRMRALSVPFLALWFLPI